MDTRLSMSADILSGVRDGGASGDEVRSRRRAWTMRNNAARQMPSRRHQAPVPLAPEDPEDMELLERMARTANATEFAESVQERADVIVQEMEQDVELMQDNPQAEEMRKEALRELPQCLTMKRTVRAKISVSVSVRSKHRPIPFTKRLKYRISFAWKRMGERTKDFFFSIELWYEAIRTIEGHFGSAVGSYFYFLRSLFIINIFLCVFAFCFVMLPQILHDQSVEARSAASHRFHNGFDVILDFFSGQGTFEDTILFYGHYHTGTVASSHYSIPFAYFFTLIVLYLFCFLALSIRTAWSYRRHFIETSAAGLGHVYASKVFCGWDFGIATRSAAADNSRCIYNEFKELLSEQYQKASTLSPCTKFGRLCIDIAINILSLATIAGTIYFFYWLLEESTEDRGWSPLVMAAIVTVVLTMGPIFFSRVVRLESYNQRTALYVTLARSFVLDASTILLLMIYWFRRDAGCWETMIGQEMYRLIILDVCLSVALIPFFEYVRGHVYMKLTPKYSLEFDLAYHSLSLVYNQALLWLGLWFSPLLSVIITLKLFLLFYVRKFVLMSSCRPARKLWRAAQTQTALNVLVWLSLLGAMCALGTAIIGSSAQHCGPFQNYNRTYEVLTEGVLNLSAHPNLRDALAFLARPGVMGLLLVALCVAVYFARARASAQKSMVAILREMIALEAKDKEFLLAAIEKVANGEWLYSPKHDPANDSHTWKYLHDANVRKPSNSGYHFERAHPVDHHRPKSFFKVDRTKENGESDSSFSWQGSSGRLNDGQSPKLRSGPKRL